MAHYDIVFPTCIGFGTSGRHEQGSETFRAVNRKSVTVKYLSQFYRAWDVATGIHTEEDFQDFINFYHAVDGPGNTFLFEDPWDNSTAVPGSSITDTDETLGTGDGIETDFQLIKTRTYGAASTATNIYHPDTSGLLVTTVLGAQTLGVDYTESDGLLTFGAAPASGSVTAGFPYYLKAEFASDTFPMRAPDRQGQGTFFLQGSITVVEVPT